MAGLTTGEIVVGVGAVPVAAMAVWGTGFGNVSVGGAIVGFLTSAVAGVTAAATADREAADMGAVAVSAGREPVAGEFWPWREWRR